MKKKHDRNFLLKVTLFIAVVLSSFGCKIKSHGINNNQCRPCFSPDGKKILFSVNVDNFGSLYECELKTKKITRIKLDIDADEPSYSHNGKKIVFHSSNDEKDSTDLFILNREDNTVERLIEANEEEGQFSPIFNYGDTKIIYRQRSKHDGRSTICAINIETKEIEILSEKKYVVIDDLNLTTDNKYLVFSEEYYDEGKKERMARIVRIDIENKTDKILLDKKIVYTTVINPVDNKIMFFYFNMAIRAYKGDGMRPDVLYSMDLDGGNIVEFFWMSVDSNYLRISADGNYVLFGGFFGSYSIYDIRTGKMTDDFSLFKMMNEGIQKERENK